VSKFGIEPGSLHGLRPRIEDQEPEDDPDGDLIKEAKALDAKSFRKRFGSGRPEEAALNAALARKGISR
jgi:hypothetical protein